MSRCSSLYQALANASGELVGVARGTAGRSSRRPGPRAARGRWSASSAAPLAGVRAGRAPSPRASLATHWCAPAGLSVSSHSWPNRFSKKPLPHLVGRARPGHLETAGDRVARPCRCRRCSSSRGPAARAGSPRARGRRSRAERGAVGLAEGVAAGDQRDGLLVVHRHPAERLADVAGRGERVGVAVGALGVDVDQAHLHGAERVRTARGRRCSARRRARCPRGPRRSPRAPRCPRGRSRSRRSGSPWTPGRRCRRAPAGRPTRSCWPYFCLTGHSSRRALSRLALSGQLFSGAKRCAPSPAPPRPSAMR